MVCEYGTPEPRSSTAARGFGVVGRQGYGASFFVPHGEARRASLAASVPRVTANCRRRRQARRAAAYAGYSLSPARPRGGHVRSGRAAAWSYPCSSSTCCFLLNLFSSSGGAPLPGELAPRGGATLVQCANRPIACKNCPPKIPSEGSFSYYPRFMRGQSKAGSHVADACAAKHSSICSAVVLSSDSGGSSFRPK